MRYVTRSVANHLNGISKKDPHLASTPSNGGEAQGTSGRARWAMCDSPCRPDASPRITLAPVWPIHLSSAGNRRTRAALNTWPAAAEGITEDPESVAPQDPAGSIAEPDHEPIQVIALRDRVPAHSRRAGRHDIVGQEPVQEDVGLQDGEWPARASVVAVAEAQ